MNRFLLLPLLAAASFAQVAIANEPAKAAASAADPAKGQAIASTVCAACHAADGNSVIPVNPKLAGQHADYLLKQMKNFKAAGGKPAERVDPIMNGMIAAYDEAQMRDMAAWFASQQQKNEKAKNRATIEAGQKLFRAGDTSKGLPACAACHGPAGAGIPAQYPRIQGQYAEYIEKQLKAFRDGTRANDPAKMMSVVALKMTDAEIKAVSDYVAGLR